MNQKLEIPHGFALCGEAECLCAEGCLRHRAYLQQAETVKVFTVVNGFVRRMGNVLISVMRVQ